MYYVFKSLQFLFVLGLTSTTMEAFANPSEKQLKQLTVNCLQCHADPRTEAPLMGNPNDWQPVIKKGLNQVTQNVIHGINGMPPAGYCSSCSEQDLLALIKLISGVQEWPQ